MRTPTASCLWPEGSLTNKAILVPAALLISAFLPGLITPLLMPDGFLCFEGVENLAHKLLHGKAEAEMTHTNSFTKVREEVGMGPAETRAIWYHLRRKPWRCASCATPTARKLHQVLPSMQRLHRTLDNPAALC